MTYKARLNAKLNGAARITLHSLGLIDLDRLAMIKAKAAAHIANNPAPRADYSRRVQTENSPTFTSTMTFPVCQYIKPKPAATMYRNATNLLAFYIGLATALVAAF